jgi:hypothetical protein
VILVWISAQPQSGYSNSNAQLCSNVNLVNGVASCPNISQLSLANHSIQASYGGSSNYNPSTGGPVIQIIQDFGVVVSSTTVVDVLQGFTNTNGPFGQFQPVVTVLPQSLNNFSGTLMLGCVVTSVPVVTPMPTCVVNSPSISDPGGQTTLTISAVPNGSPSPAGAYTITVTGTYSYMDQNNQPATVSRPSAAFTFYVAQLAAGVAVAPAPAPGGSIIANVTFYGPAVSNLTYSCDQVLVGSSSTPVSPQSLKISCSFGPQTQPLPALVSVTIQTDVGATVGELRNPAGVFNALWLGMPAVVLVGSLRGKKLSHKTILQLLGLLLVTVALLQGIGCGGGGFTPPSTTNGTPSGSYQVHVVGMANGQVMTSAVVPLSVVGH